MKLCEILLMSIVLILGILGIVVIVTDFHAGVIKNRGCKNSCVYGK